MFAGLRHQKRESLEDPTVRERRNSWEEQIPSRGIMAHAWEKLVKEK